VSPSASTYYCINFPKGLVAHLVESLTTSAINETVLQSRTSLLIDVLIVEYQIRAYRRGIGEQRNKLKEIVSAACS
jgi:hypothetical protein